MCQVLCSVSVSGCSRVSTMYLCNIPGHVLEISADAITMRVNPATDCVLSIIIVLQQLQL